MPTWDKNPAEEFETYTYTTNPQAKLPVLPIRETSNCGTQGFAPSTLLPNGWAADSACLCEPGYYCPRGSSSREGKPVTIELLSTDQCKSANACKASVVGASCRCDPGHYCPKGSTSGRGCPLLTSTLA